MEKKKKLKPKVDHQCENPKVEAGSELMRAAAPADISRPRRLAMLVPSLPLSIARHAHLFACTGGLVVMLVVYGVCQERIMSRPFDGDAYFNQSLFLVLCNRLTTIAVAGITLAVSGDINALRPSAPLTAYASVSLANVAATTCQYEALKYVSFGVQTLAKCLKPVPVMAWGALWLRRAYSRVEITTAIAVMAGCWLFMTGGSVADRAVAAGHATRTTTDVAPHAAGGGSTAAGAAVTGTTTANAAVTIARLTGGALLAAFLAADGLTSTLQGRMFDKGPGVSITNQVLYVSLFSCAVSMVGLAEGGVAATAGITAALAFCVAHPSAGLWIAALSASATASSLLITTTVRHYGPLALSLTMTVRQLASVLVSSAMNGHDLTRREVAGLALVFTAIFLQGGTKMRNGTTASGKPHPSGVRVEVKLRLPTTNKPEEAGFR